MSLMGNIPKRILNKETLGMSAVIIAEPMIDSALNRFVPQQQIFGTLGLDDVVKIVGGAMLSKRKGFVGSAGKMLVALGLARAVSGLMQGGLNASAQGAGNTF